MTRDTRSARFISPSEVRNLKKNVITYIVFRQLALLLLGQQLLQLDHLCSVLPCIGMTVSGSTDDDRIILLALDARVVVTSGGCSLL